MAKRPKPHHTTAEAFDLFVDATVESMREELGPSWQALVPEFVVGTLGSDAGRLGVADLARSAGALS